MHWTERQRAKINLASCSATAGGPCTVERGPLRPADRLLCAGIVEGITEKDGFVVVVDVFKGSSVLKHSGGQKTTRQVRGENCAHCGGSGKERVAGPWSRPGPRLVSSTAPGPRAAASCCLTPSARYCSTTRASKSA